MPQTAAQAPAPQPAPQPAPVVRSGNLTAFKARGPNDRKWGR